MNDGLPYVLPDAWTITTPEAGGISVFGMSYWLPFEGCPRRSFLERQTGRGFAVVNDENGDRKVNRYNKPILNQTKTGVLFHKILEHYHAHEACNCTFRYSAAEEDLEWQEALRYFAAYRPVTPADLFGRVEACEESFSYGVQSTPGAGLSGVQHQQRAAALDLLGVPFFTGRRDMRTKIVTETKRDYWIGEGAFDLELGDDVLVDTKTKTQENSTLLAEMNESAQFHAYMMVMAAQGMKVKGTIANVVVGTKEIKLRKMWVPYPTERQQQVIKQRLTYARWVRDNLGETFANPSHCFDYFKTCPFFMQECDRTNPELEGKLLTLRPR